MSLTIGALALGCAAMVYAAAAGGCNTPDAIIHFKCDAGTKDSGDGGAGGAGGADPNNSYCE